MPKATKFPKFRTYVKRGRGGQVWTSFAYDMRGTGKPDIPLGSDYDEAMKRWAEIHHEAPRIAGTLEEAFKAWELDAETGLLSERLANKNTNRTYRKNLRAMRPALGAARWAEVTLPALNQYVKARTAKSQARQEMQLLSVIWGWARLEGLTDLPYPAIDMQRSGWKGLVGVRTVKVTDTIFDAIYRHADPMLRDALDIATATGLRVEDVINLRISDATADRLAITAGKTQKDGEFDLTYSKVLQPIIERRKAMKGPEHIFILAAGRNVVTYRRLHDRYVKARKAAMKEVPECKGVFLRDMRKRASQLAGSLAEASALLQHSSLSVTKRHYRGPGETLKPVR